MCPPIDADDEPEVAPSSRLDARNRVLDHCCVPRIDTQAAGSIDEDGGIGLSRQGEPRGIGAVDLRFEVLGEERG
jgi:hypothetical protein